MVESSTEWRVLYCRRHVDCVEGVQMGVGVRCATKVTHEAAIGSVDKKQGWRL